MTYTIRPTGQFRKDLKKIQKRGYDISLLTDVVKLLAEGKKIPEKNETISFLEPLQVAENVILLLIGY